MPAQVGGIRAHGARRHGPSVAGALCDRAVDTALLPRARWDGSHQCLATDVAGGPEGHASYSMGTGRPLVSLLLLDGWPAGLLDHGTVAVGRLLHELRMSPGWHFLHLRNIRSLGYLWILPDHIGVRRAHLYTSQGRRCGVGCCKLYLTRVQLFANWSPTN